MWGRGRSALERAVQIAPGLGTGLRLGLVSSGGEVVLLLRRRDQEHGKRILNRQIVCLLDVLAVHLESLLPAEERGVAPYGAAQLCVVIQRQGRRRRLRVRQRSACRHTTRASSRATGATAQTGARMWEPWKPGGPSAGAPCRSRRNRPTEAGGGSSVCGRSMSVSGGG